MIKFKYNNTIQEVSTIRYLNIVFTSVRKGSLIIWEAIKSCFGSGLWKNTSTWSNTETWKN